MTIVPLFRSTGEIDYVAGITRTKRRSAVAPRGISGFAEALLEDGERLGAEGRALAKQVALDGVTDASLQGSFLRGGTEDTEGWRLFLLHSVPTHVSAPARGPRSTVPFVSP